MKLQTDYTSETTIYFEQSMDIAPYNYLVIFGHHANGGFICIPNHRVAVEASEDEVEFNVDQLISVGITEKAAQYIATYIDKWVNENKSTVRMAEEKSRQAFDCRMKAMGFISQKHDASDDTILV